MKAKKNFVGVAVSLALIINSPQALADEVEIFDVESDGNVVSESVEFLDEYEDLGPILIFNDPEKLKLEENSSAEVEKTPVNVPSINVSDEDKNIVDEPYTEITPANITPIKISPVEESIKNPDDTVIFEKPEVTPISEDSILPPSRIQQQPQKKEKQKKPKTLKPRFVKLAMDDTYTYYLDKQTISWQRIPYSASEYMIDVWVRLIERNVDTSNLPAYMSEYIEDTTNGEIEIAAEKGIAFAPVDVEVLQNKKFFLEHYYLRPKTKQIQFLCELEVVGNPQNTISEREYDYKNWENLVPSSIESIIYHATIKEVGKSGSSDKGHMSFADKLEEYARISIR